MNYIVTWTKGLRGKLLLMGFTPLIALALTGLFAKQTVDELHTKLNFAYQVRAELIRDVGKMAGSIHATGRWVWITYGIGNNVTQREKFIKLAKDELEKFEETKAAYIKLPRNEAVKAMFSKVEELWPATKAGVEESLVHFAKHTPDENEEGKKVLQAKVLPNLVPITKTFDEIESAMDEILKKEIEKTETDVSRSEKFLLLIITVCGLSMFLFSILLANRLAKTQVIPIRKIR